MARAAAPRPRRPGHPYLVALPLLAVAVAAIASVVAQTPADGSVVRQLWWWSLAAALALAVPTVISGALDLRALRPATRAAKSAQAHGGVMVGSLVILGFAAVRGAGAGTDDPVGAFDLVLTLVGAAVLFGGGVLGAVSMHIWGAGSREETLIARHRGGAPATTPDLER